MNNDNTYTMDNMPYLQQEDMNCSLRYPEIYYKLQPYVMMVCDEMDAYGQTMPSDEMLDNITETIYEDMRRMYPDMADYTKEDDEVAAIAPYDYYRDRDRDRRYDYDYDFRRRFTRRGLSRDLIRILLLQELLRRRRRY